MKQHSDFLKRAKCKIKHQNRMNWCTSQNFSNMYDGVYKSMVKAGVAIETPDEIMYDINGEVVKDKTYM
jgi:hypothetical protein